MTLTEVLVASTIAVVVAYGIGMIDVDHARIHEALRTRNGLLSDQGQAALAAAVHIGKQLERADRFNVAAADSLQLRVFEPTVDCGGGCTGGIPSPCCFDLPANYAWYQYSLVGNDLWFYLNTGSGCGTGVILARQITGVNFAFRDEADAPPGGEPPMTVVNADNNVLEYSLMWDDGVRSHQFGGQFTGRAIPYANLNAGGEDSGYGLAAPGVNDAPPASCS